ncbi:MAG: alkaline phosphatase D family protein [Melioribacteraceae bacterium]|nr:alkaline phosphatase D family protein [Melioribacteraceae bacterium]
MLKKTLTILLFLSIFISCDNKKTNEFLRLPMVGLILNNQVPILVKAVSDGTVRIEYKKLETGSISSTKWGNLTEENSFSTSLVLKNLDYNSEYKYRVEFDDNNFSKWFSFKTFPEQRKPGKFSVVFSSGMREKYSTPYVYENIKKMSPTFVALLGDQMYGDYDGNLNKLEEYLANDYLRKKKIEEGEVMLKEKTVLDAFRGKYHRTFVESFQHMSSEIPIMGIWDDHDFGQDNNDRTYPYKEIARKVFLETYPTYPYELETGGIFYRFLIADVDAFVLDTRWYRSPMQNAEGEDKIMLGEKQLAWFLNGLKQSTARIKIIFSSIPFNDYGGDTSRDRPGYYDSWMGYKYARNKVMSFIKENKITGVVILSADQHYPSTHILNWKAPIKHVSKTDTSVVYSLSELDNAIFDFSSGPFNYKKAAGHPLLPENQKNPLISYEVYRPAWAMPENKEDRPTVSASVFGMAEIDTESSPATVTVKFYELDKETKNMVEIYKISLLVE